MTGLPDIDELLAGGSPLAAATSFGLGRGGERDLRFATSLPADPALAQHRLREQESTARQSQALLADLETRLQQRIAAGQVRRSFGLFSDDAPFARAREALSMPPQDADDEEEGSTLEQVQTLLSRVQEFVAHPARVETRIETLGAAPFASTRVGWTGDLMTIWAGPVSDEQRSLHLRAVRRNLATRLSLVRLVSLVVAGASALAVQWALPGGSIRALTTAWRLARELIAEAKQLAAPQPANHNP